MKYTRQNGRQIISGTPQLKSIVRSCIVIGCIALVLSGCGLGPKQEELTELVEEPETVEIIVPEQPVQVFEPQYEFMYPFTGVGTEVQMNDRPVMVMVENSPLARPQSGLDQADVVFEILAEGDITRFVAVYQSESPKVIGPVRSIRPYFVEIGDGLDALIVHAGWSQDAMNLISNRKLAHFDQVYGDDAYYWRDKTRKAPHNLYTSIEKIREGAEKKKFRKDWKAPTLTFAPKDFTPTGLDAGTVKVNYISGYYVSYEYDTETKTYSRFMEGEPHKDKESGVQLTGTNIVICESYHKIVDNVGRRTVDVFGPGKGYLVQQGKVQEIAWESKDGIIRPFLDGQELPLIPGKTWIHVIPQGSEVTFE